MSDDSLEIMLVKLTNPLSKYPDVATLEAFCHQVEEEDDGPQMSLRFLAHKIQSPQEREATQALSVLEEIIKKGGPNLVSEIGKFRFLNELIKTISPKYLGSRTTPKVKERIIELMFKWSMEMKSEAKIFEAYQMLKTQGIVKSDPIHVLEQPPEPFQPPPPRPKSAVFEDEEKSKLLRKLLNSRRPEDLQAANRLIKNMVREADHRMELVERRVTEVETVNNNSKVLADMLNCYKPGETSEEEKELMKELYESSLRLRPKLFRLAGEMDEKDEGLSDILKANDQLTAVIAQYTEVLGLTEGRKKDESSLLDLNLPPKENASSSPDTSLLDDQLLALGLNDTSAPAPSQSRNQDTLADLGQIFSTSPQTSSSLPTYFGQSVLSQNNPMIESFPILNTSSSMPKSFVSTSQNFSALSKTPPLNNMPEPLQPVNVGKTDDTFESGENQNATMPKSLDSLDALGQLLKKSLPSSGVSKLEFPSTPQKIPMNQLQKQQTSSSTTLLHPVTTGTMNSLDSNLHQVNASTSSPSKSPNHEALLPIDMFVPLETIKPGSVSPITLPEKDGLKIVIHFGKDSPRPDITVMVVSTMSKNSNPIKNFSFQAAVPKSMKIKLQPPSATDLPAYNPILPPAAITQVMLLGNPNQEKVRLKYKLSYVIGEESRTDFGEVENLLGHR